jgi:hypothetical protein
MKATQTVLLVILSVALIGCGENDDHYYKRIAQYGPPMNSLREQRKIPLIPSNWMVRDDRSAVAWDNPDFRNGKKVPMHQYKFLIFTQIDSGTLLEETDHYGSGKSWVDSDAGTLDEYVRVTYSFDLEKRGKPPWTVQISEFHSRPREGTVAEADEILKKWGIDRFDSIQIRQAVSGEETQSKPKPAD